MPSVWDHRLWDTFNPQLYSFTKYNQDFLKQYTEFLDRRAKIEEKYAKDVRKLCKEFKTKEYDRKEKIKFTLQSAFDDMLAELVALSNQHDTLRDDMLKSSKDVKDTLKELQVQSQQTEKKIQSHVKELEKSRAKLESVRQVYQRSYADMRKSQEDYTTNKDNMEITKNEAERFQQIFLQKQSIFEDKKNGYAKELSDFNAAQKRYYMEQLPEQLACLQDQEQRLVAACQQQFSAWGSSELQSLDIQTKCAQALRAKADIVNAQADIGEFMRVTASGNPVPGDLPFEDLGSNDNIGQDSRIGPKPFTKGATLNKSGRTFGPAQQKRRLEELLRDKDQELDRATKEVDGIQKLLVTYRQNPKIGDAPMVQQQMQQASERLAKLIEERAEIVRELKALGVEVAGGLDGGGGGQAAAASAPAVVPVSVAQQRHASAQRSTFADEFDESPAAATPPRPAAPPTTAPAATAAPSLPVVAMLYEFNDPSQPDNLAVQAGERLHLLQREDDWSLVRRIHGNTAEQGYVPTAYMADV